MDDSERDSNAFPSRERRRTRLLSVRPSHSLEVEEHHGSQSTEEHTYDVADFGDYRGSFRATYPPPDENEYNGKEYEID